MTWEIIGGLITLAISILGFFLARQSDSDKARAAVRKAEEQKAAEDRLRESNAMSDVDRVNAEIQAQQVLADKLSLEDEAALLSQKKLTR